jgi:hypothetical protein
MDGLADTRVYKEVTEAKLTTTKTRIRYQHIPGCPTHEDQVNAHALIYRRLQQKTSKSASQRGGLRCYCMASRPPGLLPSEAGSDATAWPPDLRICLPTRWTPVLQHGLQTSGATAWPLDL